MDLPIKFPSMAEVVAEEVARFRALTPVERVRAVDEMVGVYHFLAERAARPELVAQLAAADEARGRAAVEEFVARHDRI